MRNSSLQLFSQDYGLASHTTYVMSVKFIYKWGKYSLNSTPNDRYLKSISRQFYLVFARNLLRGSRWRNLFIFTYQVYQANTLPTRLPRLNMQDYNLASHLLCVGPELQISEKLFIQILFTLSKSAANLLRGSGRRNIFVLSLLMSIVLYSR